MSSLLLLNSYVEEVAVGLYSRISSIEHYRCIITDYPLSYPKMDN